MDSGSGSNQETSNNNSKPNLKKLPSFSHLNDIQKKIASFEKKEFLITTSPGDSAKSKEKDTDKETEKTKYYPQKQYPLIAIPPSNFFNGTEESTSSTAVSTAIVSSQKFPVSPNITAPKAIRRAAPPPPTHSQADLEVECKKLLELRKSNENFADLENMFCNSKSDFFADRKLRVLNNKERIECLFDTEPFFLMLRCCEMEHSQICLAQRVEMETNSASNPKTEETPVNQNPKVEVNLRDAAFESLFFLFKYNECILKKLLELTLFEMAVNQKDELGFKFIYFFVRNDKKVIDYLKYILEDAIKFLRAPQIEETKKIPSPKNAQQTTVIQNFEINDSKDIADKMTQIIIYQIIEPKSSNSRNFVAFPDSLKMIFSVLYQAKAASLFFVSKLFIKRILMPILLFPEKFGFWQTEEEVDKEEKENNPSSAPIFKPSAEERKILCDCTKNLKFLEYLFEKEEDDWKKDENFRSWWSVYHNPKLEREYKELDKIPKVVEELFPKAKAFLQKIVNSKLDEHVSPPEFSPRANLEELLKINNMHKVRMLEFQEKQRQIALSNLTAVMASVLVYFPATSQINSNSYLHIIRTEEIISKIKNESRSRETFLALCEKIGQVLIPIEYVRHKAGILLCDMPNIYSNISYNQIAKDVQRDFLIINGQELRAPSIEQVLKVFVDELLEVEKKRIKQQHTGNSANNESADFPTPESAREVAIFVLKCCGRTSGAGDAYDSAQIVFGVNPKILVMQENKQERYKRQSLMRFNQIRNSLQKLKREIVLGCQSSKSPTSLSWQTQSQNRAPSPSNPSAESSSQNFSPTNSTFGAFISNNSDKKVDINDIDELPLVITVSSESIKVTQHNTLKLMDQYRDDFLHLCVLKTTTNWEFFYLDNSKQSSEQNPLNSSNSYSKHNSVVIKPFKTYKDSEEPQEPEFMDRQTTTIASNSSAYIIIEPQLAQSFLDWSTANQLRSILFKIMETNRTIFDKVRSAKSGASDSTTKKKE